MNPRLLLTMTVFHTLVVYLLCAALLLWHWPRLWLPVFALFLGLLTGLVDLQSQEPQLPALLLLASGFFMASARPREAWLWPLLIAPWIPVLGLARAALEFTSWSQALISAVAFVPAFIGAGAGALVARAGRFQIQILDSSASSKS